MGSNNSFLNSLTNFMSGIVSRSAVDKLRYSASVVLKAVSDCSLDAHRIGHPAYRITYPVRDFAVEGSSIAVALSHSPLKSASA